MGAPIRVLSLSLSRAAWTFILADR
jgi:hypothetical protein